nr:ceramidase domain-containing protein [uncultured Celeribacter sp.]
MWQDQINVYCERSDFGFWSEPVNAMTNLAFLLAALYVWPRTKGVPLARALAVVLFCIGLGSFAFHTTATRWGALADILPILLFILIYIFAITRDAIGAGAKTSALVTLAFFPFAMVFVPVFQKVGLGDSAAYAPEPLLIFLYALVLRSKAPKLAKGMALGGVLLCVSIGFRMLDGPVCATVPVGSHFMWHLLNALMLGYMIRVYCAHMLEGASVPR